MKKRLLALSVLFSLLALPASAGLLWNYASPGSRHLNPTPTIPPANLIADLEYDGSSQAASLYSDSGCSTPVTSGAVLCVRDNLSGTNFASAAAGQSVTSPAGGINGVPVSSWTGADASGLVSSTLGTTLEDNYAVTIYYVVEVSSSEVGTLYSIGDSADGLPYVLTFVAAGAAQGNWKGINGTQSVLSGGTIATGTPTVLEFSGSTLSGCTVYQDGNVVDTVGSCPIAGSFPAGYTASATASIGGLISLVGTLGFEGLLVGPIIQAGAWNNTESQFIDMQIYLQDKYGTPAP